MSRYFFACNTDWQNFDKKIIENEIKTITNGICYQTFGLYDIFTIFDETDATLASKKLDKMRNIKGVNHSISLVSVEKKSVNQQ